MGRWMKRVAVALWCWSLIAGPALADEDESKRRAVDALFTDLDGSAGPGLAVGIYHQGTVRYARGYGNAALGRTAPVTTRTVFHVASVSKQFTAFAIALLVRDGKVKLGEDVRTYLPDLPHFGEPVTVGDLIHHLSGLKEQNMMFWMAQRFRQDHLKQEQALTLIKRQRELLAPPGTRFIYSNSNYTLLAAIVQAVTGKTLRQFTEERMFGPLAMRQTLFRDDAGEPIPGLAEGFAPRGKGWGHSILSTELVGPTGLYTSVDDLLKWVGNFDRPVVGDTTLIEQISAPGALRDGKPLNYGFGLFKQKYAGHDAIAHDGADSAYRATVAYLPKERFGLVLLANSPRNVSEAVRKIIEIYLGAAPGPRAIADGGAPPIKPTPELVKSLLGHYLSPYLWGADLVEKDGRLLWQSLGWPDSEITLREGDLFSRKLMTEQRYFRIERDAQRRVIGFRPVAGIGEDSGDLYERLPAVSPDAAQLQELAGDYRTAEFDITYTFVVRDGQLTARSIWSTKPIRLAAVAPDRYDTDDIPMGSIQFVRDPAGKSTGFRIVGGGLRGTVFERVPSYVR